MSKTTAMHARVLTTILIALVLAVPAAAQEFLPPSLSDWTADPVFRASAADFDRIGTELAATAPVLSEYGALAMERRAYQRGSATLVVTVYRMRDPTGAYGLFTFLRSQDMAGGKFGEYSALSRTRALVAVGDLVLDASGADLPQHAGDLNGFVAKLYPKARLGPLPTVGDYLPTKEQIAGSRQYAAGPLSLAQLLPLADGDWIGFSDGAEVELARYHATGGQVTLVVASYPTSQVAEQRMRQIENTLENVTSSPGAHSLAVRSVSLVAIATGAASRASAQALLRRIRYGSEVTWNEPGYSATDPTVPEMILGAIYGTGSIFLMAFLSGIAFGFLRVLVKQYFPGRIFDRPGTVEIIQLGLTSKPIEAKDFY